MSSLIIDGIFDKELRYHRFFDECVGIYKNAKFVLNKTIGHVNNDDDYIWGRFPKRKIIADGIYSDLIIIIGILSKSCVSFSKDVYYSELTRENEFLKISNRIPPFSEEGIYHNWCDYEQVIHLYSNFIKENVYKIERIIKENDEISRYFEMIMEILKERKSDI